MRKISRVISAVLTLQDKNFSSNAKKAQSATSDLEKKIKHSRNSIKRFGKSAVDGFKTAAKGAGIAAGAIAGLGTAAFAATEKVASSLDDINKASDRLGVTTDAFQEMSYWAGQNGIAAEQLEKGVGRLNQRMGLAAEGNEKYSSALEQLGVDMESVQNGTISTEDAFATSIQTLSEMTNTQEQSALASELFGTKLSRDLMPALQDGALSLDDARQKAEELGIVIDGDAIDAASKFGDTWDNIKSSVTAFGQSLIAQLMPAFQTVMDWVIEKMPAIQSTIGGVLSWLSEKGQSIFGTIQQAVQDNEPTLNRLRDTATDVGNALQSAFETVEPAITWFFEEGIPKAIDVVADLVDGAIDVYNTIVDNWSTIGPIVAGVAASFVSLKVGIFAVSAAKKTWAAVTTGVSIAMKVLNGTLRMSPLGWVATLIGLVVTAGIALWNNWDWVTEKAGELWDAASTAFGNLYDNVTEWFSGIGDWVSGTFDDIVEWAKELPGRIGEGIRNAKSAAINGVIDMANGVIGGAKTLVNGVIKGINWVMDKLSLDISIDPWPAPTIPAYAQGTNGHPGGHAILGDGGQKELFATPQGQIGMSPATDTLMNLPKGTQVLSGGDTKNFMSAMGVPHYEEGTGNWLSNAADWVIDTGKSAVGSLANLGQNIWSYITNPGELLTKALEFMGFEMPSLPGIFSDIMTGSFNFIKDNVIGWFEDKIGDIFASGNTAYNASAGVEQWRGVAAQALQMTGNFSPANLNRLLMQMGTESGGNPNAINNWDINARRGTPSKGLMQVIDPTFSAYALPGFEDIWAPLDNILASIRYTEARYGSLLAGWQGTGYATGGTVPYGQRILVGEKGPEIMDVPAQTKVHSNADSRRMMSSGGVNIEEININGHNLTVDEIVNELMRMLKLKLANM